MSEKLTIRNFGPIKDMSFDFKKINILIGDQGTGKSTIAKIVSAIYNSQRLTMFDLPDDSLSQFFGHLDLMGIKNFVNLDTFLFYETKNFRLEFANGKILIKNQIDIDIAKFNYIPAERNMVHVLADSLFALIDLKATLPKLFLRFGNKYQSSRKNRNEFDYRSILGITFIHKNNGDYVRLQNGSEIYLSDASSGIQGCVALLTVVDDITTEHLPYNNQNNSDIDLGLLVIEEPELNCFPDTQNKILKYLLSKNKVSWFVHNSEISSVEEALFKNQLFITTHSPYILTSLNNLMYAYQIGKNHKSEVEKIVERKYWINPSDVSAYMLLPNGKCEKIIDSEGLIKAEKIDGVSTILNKDFNAIMDIEINVTK